MSPQRFVEKKQKEMMHAAVGGAPYVFSGSSSSVEELRNLTLKLTFDKPIWHGRNNTLVSPRLTGGPRQSETSWLTPAAAPS